MSTQQRSLALTQLQILDPCHKSWDAMRIDGGGGRRHCDSCAKHVHDLSMMSRTEVERLLAVGEVGGITPCVRFASDSDGRVLTREDFPARPSATRRRGWLLRVASIAATLGLGSLFQLGCDRQPEATTFATGGIVPTTMPGQPVMGDIAPMQSKAAPPTTPPVGVLTQTTMGEAAVDPTKTPPPATRLTTSPANDPNIMNHTMGMIAPR